MKYRSSAKLNIVIVGGGTAGWLTAGLLAARANPDGTPLFSVTVIEPEDIPAIGVGEGSWPMMRSTLQAIGVNERDFLRSCNASFKQGSKFCDWTQKGGDFYYHPFEPPARLQGTSIIDLWLENPAEESFSDFVCRQEYLCEHHHAPKLLTTADFAGVTNYGYHFDAYKLSNFLRAHCKNHLGVKIVADKMVRLHGKENGDIAAVVTEKNGQIEGDFFIDCTGFRALLLKAHFEIGTVPIRDTLFADRAMTAHVPYTKEHPIHSTTISTAQDSGWIWDVSLANRRGVGYVHSSAHTDKAAETLMQYIGRQGAPTKGVSIRELRFSTGYLEQFWVRNCAAIGLSAGFVEPLEASSIMLTEIAAKMLSDALAAQTANMDNAQSTFNKRLTEHWKEVIDFLKLHYALSQRTEDFWRDNRMPETIPASLKETLRSWRSGLKNEIRMPHTNKLFPAESYQYVLYGMSGHPPQHPHSPANSGVSLSNQQMIKKSKYEKQRLAALLPTNRDFIASLNIPAN